MNQLPYKFKSMAHLITTDKLIKFTTVVSNCGSWRLPVSTPSFVDTSLSTASFHCTLTLFLMQFEWVGHNQKWDLHVCQNSLSVHATDFQIVMMTSSNGNIFRITGPLCGEFTDIQLDPLSVKHAPAFYRAH